MEVELDDELLQRIRDAILAAGGAPVVSAKSGVPKKTLEKYIAKRSMPSFAIAARIAEAVGLSLDELAGQRPTPAPVDSNLMEKLARLVSAVYRDAGLKLPGERATLEAAVLYNELASRITDMSDPEEVEAILPQLRYQLKKRLSEAVAEPGTGKRSA
ncbi:helix-turn-helix transcriptional regulator [Mesorhizobium sp. M0678]|uniref:helix-turn-helix domain-containing protein n=1 Tax=Mesorhizobium sp. M0678 TaxID=2956985 RepID=UPI00333A1060